VAAPGASAQALGDPLAPFRPAESEPPPDEKPPPPPPPPPAPKEGEKKKTPRTVTRVVSNERTVSRWAYVLRTTTARRSSTRRAKAILRLRTYTGDNTPELVLVLAERTLPNGSQWLLVRLPMRPNNQKGWVPRRHLGRLHTVRTHLRLNRRTFRATLYERGRRIWSAPIGVGKRQWPTPGGRFYIRNRLVPREKGGIYGVLAFGTSGHSSVLTDWPGGGVIGVHGTNEPNILPGRVSHGCVRVRNPDIRRLDKLMPVGTPVQIL